MKNKKPSKDKELIKIAKKMELAKKRAKVYRHGVDVFGKQEKFDLWMSMPNFVLGGKKPEELLSTEEDLEELDAILYRIEHGIIS